MPVYYGARNQRGMGIGGMFKSFARWILPVFSQKTVLPLPVGPITQKVNGCLNIKTSAS